MKSFQDIIDAIEAYGPHLLAPTYHEIRISNP